MRLLFLVLILFLMLIGCSQGVIVDREVYFVTGNTTLTFDKPHVFNIIEVDNNTIKFDNFTFTFDPKTPANITIHFLFPNRIELTVQSDCNGRFTLKLPENIWIIYKNYEKISIETTNSIELQFSAGETTFTIIPMYEEIIEHRYVVYDEESFGIPIDVEGVLHYVILHIIPQEKTPIMVTLHNSKIDELVLYKGIDDDKVIILINNSVLDKHNIILCDYQKPCIVACDIFYIRKDITNSIVVAKLFGYEAWVQVVDEITFKPLQNLTIISYSPNFKIIDMKYKSTQKPVKIAVRTNGYIMVIDNVTGISRMILVSKYNTNYTIYFPTNYTIFVEFEIRGALQFNNGDLIIKKYINGSLVEIDRRKIGADFTTNHYLVADEHYTIYITDYFKTEMRCIGYFSSPISKRVILNINPIESIPLQYGNIVDYAFITTNKSVSVAYRVKTPHEFESVEFIVYDEKGNEIFRAESNETKGTFTYLIEPNKTYSVEFRVKTATGVQVAKYVIGVGGKIEKIGISAPEWLLNMLFGGLCIFTALTIGKKSIPAGLLISTLMVGLFYHFGLLHIPLQVIATLIIITALSFFAKRGG